MPQYTLSFKPAVGLYGRHDPSAALFEDGQLRFAIEEERLTRRKHATATFPSRSIEACLEFRGLDLSDVDEVVLPYDPTLRSNILGYHLRDSIRIGGAIQKLNNLSNAVRKELVARYFPKAEVTDRLAEIGTPVPPVSLRSHHACHAASAFHPSTFDEAAVFTIDAKGEYDSTVVWHGTPDGLERVRTYDHPNSLGLFYAVVTEFLGYRMFNGEGKVMGLAPYGNENPAIESALRSVIDTGVDYDVTGLTGRWGTDYGVERLEELFGRSAKAEPTDFDQWEKDLAHTAQALLEETVADLVDAYCRRIGTGRVGLSGGVALNCKLNKRVMELPSVDDVFVQPASNDAGLALGAGWIDRDPTDVEPMETAYWGPEYDVDAVEERIETNKLAYARPDDLERTVAEALASGAIVGWFQGRLEFGPRALGNRSILASPRSEASRDRVNRSVKHREEWRPFAPSMVEEAADDYLVDATAAPFMIRSFDVEPEKRDEIPAALHPADGTTRPQTVSADANPRYHRLLREFEELTGTPVLLNTSFNDHGEPIVTEPIEAIKDFFGTGLDLLVIEDLVVAKFESTLGSGRRSDDGATDRTTVDRREGDASADGRAAIRSAIADRAP
ncbi:carbamoyltransferase C-terminal domain-containing protein [Halorubrum sp. Eb13]|uniref:carbamoyltransferase family protein n=1 Tax=Halorubrum sp. Eb13 TaxID=1383843 RepID=UPI000B97EE09|nr:carbamoyltransferase C-terminal domain-containing protein [Halorubrum sp. Eb13]OYR39204.1 carbamoyltransferase [Halorubrum sp. Eb13]